MRMPIAFGLCIALSVASQAQDTENFQDTIRIIPFPGAQVLVVGNDLRSMASGNNLELLKNKMIQDYKEAARDENFPADAHTVYYLAAADGRRRLKTKPETESDAGLQQEISSFRQNLPAYQFIIYDLAKDYRYLLFVQNPSQLDSLAAVNLAQALQDTWTGNKEQSNAVTLEISKPDQAWQAKPVRSSRQDVLVLSTPVGAGLINNQWTPMIGMDAGLIFTDKYGRPRYKLGALVNFRTLSSFENLEFSKVNLVTTPQLQFLLNLNRSLKKETWFGLSIGRMHVANGGSLNRAWQAGIVLQQGHFGIQYDVLRNQNKQRSQAVTFSFSF